MAHMWTASLNIGREEEQETSRPKATLKQSQSARDRAKMRVGSGRWDGAFKRGALGADERNTLKQPQARNAHRLRDAETRKTMTTTTTPSLRGSFLRSKTPNDKSWVTTRRYRSSVQIVSTTPRALGAIVDARKCQDRDAS